MLWWLVQNAVVAALLAAVVMLLCRAVRPSPAVRHALWLVVLLRLVMPPVVTWPWAAPDLGLSYAAPANAPAAAIDVVPPGAEHAPSQPAVVPPPTLRRVEAALVDDPSASNALADLGLDLQPAAKAPPQSSPPTRAIANAAPTAPRAAPAVARPAPTSPPAASARPARALDAARIARWLLWLWLAGSAIVALVQLRRIVAFQRLQARGQAAPGWMLSHMNEMAERLGVRPPAMRVVAGLPQPLLWCVGRPKLLWPKGCDEQFQPDHWRGILAHELAHLRRRDHWIGWLELAAGCLWWWNPLFWYVRRALYENAELACDGLVVWALPHERRHYAEALLAVSQLLSSGGRWAVLLQGMAGGSRQLFERRLTMIMRGSASSRLSLRSVLAIGLLAAVALPGWPQREGGEAGARVIMRDDFDGRLGLPWNILNSHPTHFSLEKKPGTLTVTTQQGSMTADRVDFKNLFLINIPPEAGENLQITALAQDFAFKEKWNQASLTFWADPDNYIKFGYEMGDLGDPVRGIRPSFALVIELNGQTRVTTKEVPEDLHRIWLRIVKQGNMYAVFASTDGTVFEEIDSAVAWRGEPLTQAGFIAMNGRMGTIAPEVDVSFDSFELATVAPAAAAATAAEPAQPATGPRQAAPSLAAIRATSGTAGFQIPDSSLKIPDDALQCAENLLRVLVAIQAYENDKGRLPDALSELVPGYVSATALLCPVNPSYRNPYLPDPKLPNGYCYEFTTVPYASGGLAGNTPRAWKLRQVQYFGAGIVPIVRCLSHLETQGVALNVTPTGRLYTSELDWEALFPREGAPLMQDLAPVAAPVPAAAPAGPPNIVATSPAVGATDVSADTKEITVTFDQDMAGGFSWTGGGELYPKTTARPFWRDARTCVLPVALEPGHLYRVGINSKSYQNFRSRAGVPARPSVINFTTAGASKEQIGGLTPPRIVEMAPANGATGVSPSVTELRVTFDREMGGGFSWTGGGDNYPEVTNRPFWTEGRKTCVLPVKLKPNWTYGLGINSPSHKNFQSATGVPADWTRWTFQTGAQ